MSLYVLYLLHLRKSDGRRTRRGRELTNSVFDIGGGRPKIFALALDRTRLGVMYYEGEEYDFIFSKIPLHVKTEFSFHEDGEYDF